jgi:hypothetical protein
LNLDRLYELGCAEAEARGGNVIVILDFGDPQPRGAILIGSPRLATFEMIISGSEEFLKGYWECSRNIPGAHLTLAIGTNNTGIVACPSESAREHGERWADVVNEVNNWIANGVCYMSGQAVRCNRRYRLAAVGAIDIEAWGLKAVRPPCPSDLRRADPKGAREWVDAYMQNTFHRYYDFGTCENCGICGVNPFALPSAGKPEGEPSQPEWTLEDYWQLSWGLRSAYPMPEIYLRDDPSRGWKPHNACQWQHLSLYGIQEYSRKIYFHGSLTQCGDVKGGRDKDDSLCERSQDGNKPEEGWTQLFYELFKDQRTRQFNLWWSTDITWR